MDWCRSCWLAASLAVLSALMGLRDVRGAEPGQADIDLLRRVGVAGDTPSLLAFFRERTDPPADTPRIARLIEQLGDEAFGKRTEASRLLVALGAPARKYLKALRPGDDAERAARVRECIQGIEEEDRLGLAAAAARLLIQRRAPGTVAVLLGYLPSTTDERVQEEIWFGLDKLVRDSAEARQALAAVLDDRAPARRALAACILGRLGSTEQKIAAAQRLSDPNALVALHAAQGLLAGQETVAVPRLIELLDQDCVEVGWQAEELLRWLARASAPEPVLGAGDEWSRHHCRKAWEEWWRQQGPTFDWRWLEEEPSRPGLWLICDSVTEQQATGRIYLCGCDGKPRWRIEGFRQPLDMQLLPGPRILVTDAGVPELSERDLHGESLWRSQLKEPVLRTFRTPHGRLIATDLWGLGEVTRQGERANWIQIEFDDTYCFDDLRALPNGQIWALFSRSGQLGQLIELGFPSARAERRLGCPDLERNLLLAFQPLTNGNTMVYQNRLEERAPDGRVVKAYPYLLTYGAFLGFTVLWNGNMVEAGKPTPDQVGFLSEMEPTGRVVAETMLEKPCRFFRPCFPLLRLGFHDPRPPQIDSNSVANRIREFAGTDRLRRERATLHLLELGTKARSGLPFYIEALKDPDPEHRRFGHWLIEKCGGLNAKILRQMLRDPHPNVRAEACTLHWPNSSPEPLVMELIAALRDLDRDVRLSAASKLGAATRFSPWVLPALVESLQDPDPGVRSYALMSIGLHGSKASYLGPVIVRQLRNWNPETRRSACSVLIRIGAEPNEVIPELVAILSQRRFEETWPAAVSVLGVCGDEAQVAIPVLERLLIEGDGEVRKRVVVVLNKLRKSP